MPRGFTTRAASAPVTRANLATGVAVAAAAAWLAAGAIDDVLYLLLPQLGLGAVALGRNTGDGAARPLGRPGAGKSVGHRLRIAALTTLATFLIVVGPSWAGASTTPAR